MLFLSNLLVDSRPCERKAPVVYSFSAEYLSLPDFGDPVSTASSGIYVNLTAETRHSEIVS